MCRVLHVLMCARFILHECMASGWKDLKAIDGAMETVSGWHKAIYTDMVTMATLWTWIALGGKAMDVDTGSKGQGLHNGCAN
jgi:hypothetical protein